MPITNLYLRTQKNDKPRPIILSFSFDGKRIKLSTGEKILPKYWLKNKQQVSNTRTGSPEINQVLKHQKELVNKIYREAKLKGISPTITYIREQFNEGNQTESEHDFFEFVDKYIEQAASTKAPRTVTSYKQTKNVLLTFQKYRKKKITFSAIDLGFYYEFVEFMTQIKEYATNTIGGHIKELKVFLNDAYERDIHNNLAFRGRKFKTVQEVPDTIYLTENELQTMYEFDLSAKPKLEKVRDLFMIGCDTGLRISDLKRLNKSNLKAKTIEIKTKKTGENVVVPYRQRVREILAKYDGNIPPTISEQKYNDYLKELGKLIGLDEPINTTITKAGKKLTKTKPKYSLITSHTARRSFATNAYKNDVPVIAIMKITGHRTERSFMKYIKVSKQENAEQLANHPFFK